MADHVRVYLRAVRVLGVACVAWASIVALVGCGSPAPQPPVIVTPPIVIAKPKPPHPQPHCGFSPGFSPGFC
jgi:hypothetical protein